MTGAPLIDVKFLVTYNLSNTTSNPQGGIMQCIWTTFLLYMQGHGVLPLILLVLTRNNGISLNFTILINFKAIRLKTYNDIGGSQNNLLIYSLNEWIHTTPCSRSMYGLQMQSSQITIRMPWIMLIWYKAFSEYTSLRLKLEEITMRTLKFQVCLDLNHSLWEMSYQIFIWSHRYQPYTEVLKLKSMNVHVQTRMQLHQNAIWCLC